LINKPDTYDLSSGKKLLSQKPVLIGILVLVSIAVYINTLSNGFVFEDNILILKNTSFRDVRNIPEIFLSDSTGTKGGGGSNYYRPVMNLLFMADYHIFGLSAWGFHLTNVVLHAVVTILVFFTAFHLLNKPRSLQPSGAEPIRKDFEKGYKGKAGDGTAPGAYKPYNLKVPFVAALLFATHPIHTVVVAWASGVQELSFAFFYLLSFYFYMRADGLYGKWFLSSVFFFFLAALSKETALSLPVLLFAYDYSLKRFTVLPLSTGTFTNLVKRYLPYVVVAGIYLILRIHALGGFAPLKGHEELSGYEHLINITYLFAKYIKMLVLPLNMSASYVALNPITSLLGWKGITSLVITSAFIIALCLLRNRNRVVFFALLWVAIPLLPVFFLTAIGEFTFAENYLYLPSMGFVIVLSMGLCGISRLDLLSGRATGTFIFTVVLLLTALYSYGTVNRNLVWKDGLSLWTDTIEKFPDDHMAHNNLGLAYDNQGRANEAIGEYKEALRLKPDYAKAHNNLGLAYYDMGRMDEAMVEYKKAISLRPGYANAHNNLGIAYYDMGRMDEAIGEYKKAISLRPGYADAHNNLGIAYYDMGRMDEAIGEYKKAISLRPGYANVHNNLGLAYYDMGRMDEAIDEYKKAIKVKPGFAKAHNNLGTAYITQGRIDEAINEYREALRLAPDLTDTRFNLALAYKKKGLKKQEARKILEGLLVENNHSSQ
jgi:Flp pilus assembly protein TadD